MGELPHGPNDERQALCGSTQSDTPGIVRIQVYVFENILNVMGGAPRQIRFSYQARPELPWFFLLLPILRLLCWHMVFLFIPHVLSTYLTAEVYCTAFSGPDDLAFCPHRVINERYVRSIKIILTPFLFCIMCATCKFHLDVCCSKAGDWE